MMTPPNKSVVVVVLVIVAATAAITSAATATTTTDSAAIATTAAPREEGELIELSYTFKHDAPTYPTLTQFQLKIVKKGFTQQGYWLELNDICTSEHAGTHVDAPVHYSNRSWSLEAIPTDRLWRIPGVVVDVSAAVQQAKDKNYEVKVKELEKFEKLHGVIPDGAIVIIRTGWATKVKNIMNYAGLNQYNKLNFPGLGKGAAEWVSKHGQRHGHSKGIVAVGIDTLSLDKGSSVIYPAHRALADHNIYGIENLANLDKLPETGFYLTVMPLRIKGASGSPARIIAEVGNIVNLRATSPASNILHNSSTLPLVITATLAFWLLLQA